VEASGTLSLVLSFLVVSELHDILAAISTTATGSSMPLYCELQSRR